MLTRMGITLIGMGVMLYGMQLQAMSLQEFVTDSVQANPDIRKQIHYYRQVVEDKAVASSGWLPRIDLDASAGRYSGKSPQTQQQQTDYNTNQGSLTLTQNLFSGFDTVSQVEQNEARLEAAKHMLLHESSKAALEAVRVYLGVLKQARLVELAKENLAVHEAILAQIDERYESGVGRRSELEQTQGRVARAHASMIAQENNLQDALTIAHRVLGRYINADTVADPELPMPAGAAIESLIETAMQQHPSLQVAIHNVEARMAEYRRSRSKNYPQLNLILQKQVGDNMSGLDGRTDEHSAVLNLRYNLYNGGADIASQRRSISMVHEQQSSADRVRRELIETVRFAVIADQALHQQLEQLEKHHAMASRSADSFREEFLIGQRDLLDVLDAENERNIAHNRLIEARYDALLARYRVYEASGQMFDTIGLDVTLEDDDIHIIAMRVNQRDTLPLNTDRDDDGRIQVLDECDNSLSNILVDRFGCMRTDKSEFTAVNAMEVEDKLHVKDKSIIIEPLMFEFDSTELTPESREMMIDITRRLQATTGKIEVRAHTDTYGSDQYNINLSQSRAERVREYLLDAGIASTRIRAVGAGSRLPVTRNDRKESRATNRRVEFYLSPAMPVDIPVVIAEPIQFVLGSTELTERSLELLPSIAALIRASGKQHVEIRVHTDSTGTDEFNMKLSQRRADTVSELLKNEDVGSLSVSAIGMGSRHPVAHNYTTEGMARNQRVEIYLYD